MKDCAAEGRRSLVPTLYRTGKKCQKLKVFIETKCSQTQEQKRKTHSNGPTKRVAGGTRLARQMLRPRGGVVCGEQSRG